jgi:flavorubredoxin
VKDGSDMKIMIVYDSLGGSTEKMAKAIAEGAGSVVGTVVEVKKIGEPFSLSMLAKADGVAFGSPCIYANVTEGMRSFLENMKAYVKAGKMDVKGKRAAIFGSYGWDGAWVMEEKLKAMVQEIGYRVSDDVCVETGSNIKYHADVYLEKCKAFGKDFAESIK